MQGLEKFKDQGEPEGRPLEERKLDYVHLTDGQRPQSPSTVS